MIRKGSDYIDSIRANRDVYMNGEKVKDITKHPMFKPIIGIRAKIYDMQHDAKSVSYTHLTLPTRFSV